MHHVPSWWLPLSTLFLPLPLLWLSLEPTELFLVSLSTSPLPGSRSCVPAHGIHCSTCYMRTALSCLISLWFMRAWLLPAFPGFAHQSSFSVSSLPRLSLVSQVQERILTPPPWLSFTSAFSQSTHWLKTAFVIVPEITHTPHQPPTQGDGVSGHHIFCSYFTSSPNFWSLGPGMMCTTICCWTGQVSTGSLQK